MNALKIGATGMLAQQSNVDVLSNNIANINTTAFKRQRASFKDLLYMNERTPGAATSSANTLAPSGVQYGLGVNVGSVYRNFEQGAVTRTDAPLDISIQGRGFFTITMPNGDTAYTRDGAFQLNENGDLVTSQGFLLDPAINVPPEAIDINIAGDGTVTASVDDTIVNLGQITTNMFVNEAGLEAMGDNLYRETEASGAAANVIAGEDGSGELLQRHLEGSNVDAIESITDLITAQRAYELNSQIITTADEMMAAANQIR
ncbi:MAG: flagellar basal-body rod protein FlgG [Magnetococcales bacterium]|jgi:flagellar basal-body rod protein FlgG|nr:flagellar basal-body rod protein FlgG [Magnetococcales bacterium]PPR15039.1 MAG: Flagellar basal-body rod protein FlgG [Pseudomonadota bacterium]